MCRTVLAPLSEEEIDTIVASQADDESAWEEAIYVRRTPSAIESEEEEKVSHKK
jgi:hypothetical protein